MKVSTAAATLGHLGGKVGGKSTSPKKLAAIAANGRMPVKPGSRPRGRPRKGEEQPRGKSTFTSSMPVEQAAAAMGRLGGKVKSPDKLAALKAIAKLPRKRQPK